MNALRQADLAMRASEQRWGKHRLELLVDEPTRQAWDRGWQLWATATRAGDQKAIEALAPKIIAALAFMEAQATAAGCLTIKQRKVAA